MAKTKEVVKKDKKGKVIQIYKSCTQIANEMNIPLYKITRYIRNKKSIDGYIFEYTGIEYGKEEKYWINDLKHFLKENGIPQENVTLLDLTLNNENCKTCFDSKNTIKVFEDEWLFKKEIVKSRIKNYFHVTEKKVYARKCHIKEIDYKKASEFLDENHLQGKISGVYYLGLYFEDRLMSIMVFGKMRKNLGSTAKEGEYELLRFCSILNTNVIGAAGKLFKYFCEKYNPSKIISYSDNRWGDGGFYEKIGMEFSHNTKKNYYYVNEIERKRENRFSYRKDVLLKQGYSSEKTEKEIMKERGINRIYDYGCKVFVWKR